MLLVVVVVILRSNFVLLFHDPVMVTGVWTTKGLNKRVFFVFFALFSNVAFNLTISYFRH